MDRFSFFNPVKIKFGEGASRELCEVAAGLGAGRVLVVANDRARSLPCIARLESEGNALFFSGVEQNPSCETVDKIARMAREEKCGAVVGVGGGSVLDAAKLAAAMSHNDGTCREFCLGEKRVSKKGSAFVAVPTTAGTGSEASPISVITDEVQKKKFAVKSVQMFADFALVDPELSYSMPPRLTASTGLDVISHCLEGMCSKNRSILTDFLNLKAFELAWKNLPIAFEGGGNAQARNELMLASLLAGMCLGESGTTNGHPVSYMLTLEKNLEHGFACALTLPLWLEYDWNAFPARNDVARMMGVSSARGAREKLAAFVKKVGGPTSLS